MNKETEDVPDSIRPYLNEIAERLWAERAAVMVGSGFSKNAGNGFPDWNQIGDLLYQKAHGVRPDPTKHKYLNVLRLAEEVQAAIGRPVLEHLLRSNIPDLSIEPSGLHVELLDLPWVDVFTTNYDTLLERASAKVVTRRYEPVVNKEDIPYAIKPRIVKLHGSFPSERPFIITEEDYRCYPHDYAPFVNTVQQALLENTFCLIGFSGDDPNFLQWIGWIRDNLGKDKAQKIYLIGLFDLSSARLQLLAQRGIVVVDLSSCDGIEKHDHKMALSRFFNFIRSQKPHVLDWPYNPKMMQPACGADRLEEINKITAQWRRQRQAYPGWLILPHGNRENLWAFTSAWVNYLPDTEKATPGLDIQYAFELIWRLERCLLPNFNNIAELCEKLIEKYWPFKDDNPPAKCHIHPGKEELQDLPWNDLRQAWLAIAVAMLRFYREEGYLEKWKEAEIRLKILSDHLSVEQREFLKYEGFLFSLFTLDLPSAKQRLENWRPNEAQPYWMAKRAAGLAEIGLLSEAETIVRYALENVRKKLNQKVGATDFTMVSLESNAMLLGKFIQDAAAFEKGEWATLQDKTTQFNDRWNELKGFKCDPWNEILLFELTLNNTPVEWKLITEKREFDIGRISRSRHYRSTDRERLAAYAFLRFCEVVGLPYRLGSFTMVTKPALASLKRISIYSSFWAIATLVRVGDAKAVDNLFSRESVYRFSVSEADQLIGNYLDALDKCSEDIHENDAFRNDSYGVRLAQLLPEVMSRLCCKCSDKAKRRVLEFITNIYASPDKINYRNMKKLTKRLIMSISEVDQYNWIPYFIEIPFPDDLNLHIKDEFPNPFLLLELNQKPECAPVLEIQPGLVDHLFRQAALENSDRRRWAITSLVKLHKFQLLNDDQNKNLADAIWRITDQYGLPDGTDFYKFAFFSCPCPRNIDPARRFKNYVMASHFPIQKYMQGTGVAVTGGSIPLVDEIIGANGIDKSIWSVESVDWMLQRLIEWWDADKDRLCEMEKRPEGFSSIPEEFRARFTRMIELLVEVVGPKLSAESPDETKASLGRILKELREYGLPGLAAEAACLHIYPDQKAVVYRLINEALISSNDCTQRDGLSALSMIILKGNDAFLGSLDPDPASILCQFLTWSPIHSIIHALLIIIRILKNSPGRFSRNLEVATQLRLDRLLSDTAYESDNLYVNFDEKLELRRISSILATELWIYYRVLGGPIPGVVEKWREACLSADEFAEIRNAWEDCQKV